MAALVGTTFPAPTVSSSSGTVVCNFNDTTSGANVAIDFTSAPGTTAGAMQTAFESQAKAQNVTATAVPGVGDAAFIFTLDDASTNASGVATSTMEILAGSELIALSGEVTAAQMEALARYLVAQ